MGLFLIVGCTSSPSKPADSDNDDAAPKCTEPENPYTEGTGHYAGYERAEQKDPATCRAQLNCDFQPLRSPFRGHSTRRVLSARWAQFWAQQEYRGPGPPGERRASH